MCCVCDGGDKVTWGRQDRGRRPGCTCPVDYHVSGAECVACPAGGTQGATGSRTGTRATCLVDFEVDYHVSAECVACPPAASARRAPTADGDSIARRARQTTTSPAGSASRARIYATTTTPPRHIRPNRMRHLRQRLLGMRGGGARGAGEGLEAMARFRTNDLDQTAGRRPSRRPISARAAATSESAATVQPTLLQGPAAHGSA